MAPPKTGKTLICQECDTPFYVQKSYVKAGAKFCSRPCLYKGVRLVVERKCKHCESSFMVPNNMTRKVFCTKTCWNAARRKKYIPKSQRTIEGARYVVEKRNVKKDNCVQHQNRNESRQAAKTSGSNCYAPGWEE